MRTGYSRQGTRRLGNARIERLRRGHGDRADLLEQSELEPGETRPRPAGRLNRVLRLWVVGGQAVETSVVTGTGRSSASQTGQCFTPHRAISSSVAESMPAAVSLTETRPLRGPGGTSSAIPRSPRSSDSESTMTSSVSRVIANIAARIAISETTQLAS